MKIKKLDVFTLDYSKWRSGGIGPHQLGNGETQLLNDCGFMCCLGQFSKQCGVPDKLLGQAGSPQDLYYASNLAGDACCVSVPGLSTADTGDTKFSDLAIDINDDDTTTPLEKLVALRKLCHKYHKRLNFKNLPKELKKEIPSKDPLPKN